ncbi:uncharacterized protein LOC129002155 [Macrosteles quadrilineatus]|uniref:uncharacterized protein LOC129002155 n=1 Tax=Macrosteles quadrilineatus TaxID=74068 RepID=UPI0023E19AFE|nr:uncharacterized protein LOC129002155 [Macrosteles quadrilineatus]
MEFNVCCRRVVLLVALYIAVVSTASVQVSQVAKRAVSAESLSSASNNMAGGAKICHSRTPCGWAVYIPFTRTVDYFMKNTCVCPKNKVCLRTDDDLSVSAYVYRCRVDANPAEADTEPPTAAPSPS